MIERFRGLQIFIKGYKQLATINREEVNEDQFHKCFNPVYWRMISLHVVGYSHLYINLTSVYSSLQISEKLKRSSGEKH